MERFLSPGAYGGRRRLLPGCLLSDRSKAILCAAAVGLVSVGLYLTTLAPGLSWAHDSGDGGELATAARVLGLPHPPGYPTYVLLAHLFTHLPVGEVALRTNLFSAVCAATAAALLVLTLTRMEGKRTGAVGAGLALAFSPLLWSQAVVTEVHTLNGLFTALLLALAALAVPETHRTRQQAILLALATGGVWGLSLGNHPTALFCCPLVWLVLWRLRRFIPGMIGIALGLAVYLYLPLRATADPPINWGDPRTLKQFWWVISAAPYRSFVFALPRAFLPTRLLAWAGLIAQQFGWIGLFATLWGGATLWTKDRLLCGATGAIAIFCSVFAIGCNTSDSYLYLVPALICLSLWLGIGVNGVVLALEARTHRVASMVAALVIVLPLVAAVHRFPALDLSGDHVVDEFETAIFSQAPPEAVVLSQRDAYTFALWYFQYALGRRTDLIVVDPDLLGYDWYVKDLSRRLDLKPTDLQLAERGEGLQRSARALSQPVCHIAPQGPALVCAEP